MNLKQTTYTYEKKKFQKALLKHLTPITILTFGQIFLFLLFGILGQVAYINNNKTMFLATEIPAVIFVFSTGMCLAIYKMFFQNALINVNNWSYQHNLTIENNQVFLTLKSLDGLNEFKYNFMIKKIKKENDNYLLFKNSNHFIYVPAELFEANKIN